MIQNTNHKANRLPHGCTAVETSQQSPVPSEPGFGFQDSMRQPPRKGGASHANVVRCQPTSES